MALNEIIPISCDNCMEHLKTLCEYTVQQVVYIFTTVLQRLNPPPPCATHEESWYVS